MQVASTFAVYWRGDSQSTWTLERTRDTEGEAAALAAGIKGQRRFRYVADHTLVLEFDAAAPAPSMILVGRERQATEGPAPASARVTYSRSEQAATKPKTGRK